MPHSHSIWSRDLLTVFPRPVARRLRVAFAFVNVAFWGHLVVGSVKSMFDSHIDFGWPDVLWFVVVLFFFWCAFGMVRELPARRQREA